MVNPIPKRISNVWGQWNIRAVILFSLVLQIFLIFFAPLRKRTQRKWLIVTLWSAYLLADSAADYCVGLISNSQLDALNSSKSTKININTNSDLLAFWAPFLLLHLGGPDTITALALEDNELWLRHLLGFIRQVGTAAYIFMLSMPGNVLWLPTILVFIAGMIKYAERTSSLYLGSLDNFRETTHGEPNAGPNYPMLMDKYRSWEEAGIPTRFINIPDRHEISNQTTANGTTNKDYQEIGHVEVVQKAFYFFNKFKGLIADMIFSFSDRNESRKYFNGLSANDSLRVIEVELNFLYEAFYTKFLVVRSWYGFILRFLAAILITSALTVFHSMDKEKYGFDGFDIRVTYALLGGAVGLDIVAFLMLIFSDRTLVFITKIAQVRRWLQDKKPNKYVQLWLKNKAPKWEPYNNKPDEKFLDGKFEVLSSGVFFRRWNGSMSGFNLIEHCLDECSKKGESFIWGIRHILKCYYFVERQYLKYFGYSRNPFFKEVWELIFAELKRKSVFATDVRSIHTICDARGEWVINEELPEWEEAKTESEWEEAKKNLLNFVDANEVAFDESLILWHIATQLCRSWDWEESQRQDQDQLEENQSQDQSQPKENQSPDQNQSHLQLISKLISDYMMYLLIFQSQLISSIAGIGIKRFQDTGEEAKIFFKKRALLGPRFQDTDEEAKKLFKKRGLLGLRKEMVEACRMLGQVRTVIKAIDIKGDESKSLLFDACRLAKELKKLKKDLRWRIISKVWVEMLSFAATNCRATEHVQQLSKGGELISLVWLLMVRLGLEKQFQIKEAKLKLVVGKSR